MKTFQILKGIIGQHTNNLIDGPCRLSDTNYFTEFTLKHVYFEAQSPSNRRMPIT